ncbi:MAG: hypothetical protein KDJ88_19170 [Bauldia sp.]|nr:hypothetical protein [Bauldia sp.]
MISRVFGGAFALGRVSILAFFVCLAAVVAQAETFLDPQALNDEFNADPRAFMQKYNGQAVAIRGEFNHFEAGGGYVALNSFIYCHTPAGQGPLIETLKYGDYVVVRGTVNMDSPTAIHVQPCTIEPSPTDMTGLAPPFGYYACGSRYAFYPQFSFTLQEGGTYLDTEGGTGSYSYDPATQLVLLQGGKFDGLDYLFTAEPGPKLVPRNSSGGFESAIECPCKECSSE